MARSPKKDGRDLIAEAAENPQPAPDMRKPPKKKKAEDRAGMDEEEFDQKGLPKESPIIPLGHLQGTLYVLDHARQLRAVPAECRNGEMQLLFGGEAWLKYHYPLYGPPDKSGDCAVKGFNHRHVQTALITSCSRLGLFNPSGKTRGRGAHRGPNDELLMHHGDSVWQSAVKQGSRRLQETEYATGKVGNLIFPADEALSPPAKDRAETGVAEDIMALLDEWRWKEPIMRDLLFSWLCVAPVGGALDWRPHCWLVGPSGAGKSTLQKVIRQILGDWGVATGDASEAGLRQSLNQDTLAVLFDEFEPSEDNATVMRKVLSLVRVASEGADIMRGGQDHKVAKFVAKSCFLFSSIQYVAMESQDRNRMAIVTLGKIPKGKEKVRIPANLKAWGAQLRRRWLTEWPRWDDTLAAYQHQMHKQGFSAREQDTYGTLLAAGDLMLHDDTPDPMNISEETYRVEKKVRALAPLLDRARGEAEDTSTRCLRHLSSHRLPASSGRDQLTVSRWIEKAAAELLGGFANSGPANNKLKQHGLRILLPPSDAESESAGKAPEPADDMKKWHVAIAPKDFKGMAEIFASSTWQNGIWSQSLASIEGATSGKKCRFSGGAMRAVTVPMTEFVALEDVQAEFENQKRLNSSG